MIKIKNVTMKNFLSVGNQTQAVVLDRDYLTLVLGENIDQGGGGSRNGVGKTTLIQAISFAIFGLPLTNIKKDNLINKTNQKGMAVSLEYEANGKTYRIERGRKPNFVRYIVNDNLVNAPDTDEAHGESKWTQSEIEKTFGLSHNLFKHVVALHTKTVPFLSLGAGAQRDIIEELISIAQISEKAKLLKEQMTAIKDAIKTEDVRIKTVGESNERIQKTINDLNFKSTVWDREHDKKLNKMADDFARLSQFDIESEIEAHRRATSWYATAQEVAQLEKEATVLERQVVTIERQIAAFEKQESAAVAHKCHACGSELHDEQHETMLASITASLTEHRAEHAALIEGLILLGSQLETKAIALAELGDEPVRKYRNIEEALDVRNQIDRLQADITREDAVINPYIDQIANLAESGIQEVSYDYLNELSRVRDHQDFLLKLLINKDSFIRKKIIDQNLSYLNTRLNYYLGKLQLPHEVVFESDLSVSITQLGKDFDFEQLSNGEANRLVLALAWSFRDVWETMNQHMNLLMIDELVDSGMDSAGMDSALEILKKISRDSNKNIFLISHKDELVSRVGKILLVQKENGFTTFLGDQEEPAA